MKKVTYSVSNTKMVHNGFLPVEEGEIHASVSDGSSYTYTRERVLRRDAVAVLLYNTDTKCIMLTKQFRFAVHGKTDEFLTEIPAGKVDAGEDVISTAVRETLEECGVAIEPKQLVPLSSFFASPGYTAEKYHLFFASFGNQQKISDGGGLESEHEFIHVFEMPVGDFFKQLSEDVLCDAKTIMAGLLAKEKGLFK